MYGEKVIAVIIIVCFRYEGFAINTYTCGIDNSNKSDVYEGVAEIETYPWLGVLFYPIGIRNKLRMTTVVLISNQMALAAALDIDGYPKDDFRSLSRVVLGRNCSGPTVNVLDYNYHPDFSRTTYSTVAMVQLETLPVWKKLRLRSICPPPKRMKNAEIYAMTLTDDCTSTMVRIYRMEYVDPEQCKEFYRRANLDIANMWPTHVACARAARAGGGRCVWRSGTALVMRDHDQWRLLGFGVNGPGCEAPARFLDYGMYYPWVKQSLSRIGRPAITRLGPGHVIIRRNMKQLQRFGVCDREETKLEIFNDYSSIKPDPPYGGTINKVTYNLTLLSNVDYACVNIEVLGQEGSSPSPQLFLRRWCTNPFPACYDYNMLQINFVTEIQFRNKVTYSVTAYGKEIRVIDSLKYRMYISRLYQQETLSVPPIVRKEHTYFIKKFRTARPRVDALVWKTGVDRFTTVHNTRNDFYLFIQGQF